MRPFRAIIFLATEKEYADFELQLQFKLTGDKTNAGIQLRSQRIPNHHEVIGYQADLGEQYTGCLYDESRRNKKRLAGPKADEMAAVIQPDAWNDYRIRCRGRRIELWINGHLTVDYTESDPSIPQHGIIETLFRFMADLRDKRLVIVGYVSGSFNLHIG